MLRVLPRHLLQHSVRWSSVLRGVSSPTGSHYKPSFPPRSTDLQTSCASAPPPRCTCWTVHWYRWSGPSAVLRRPSLIKLWLTAAYFALWDQVTQWNIAHSLMKVSKKSLAHLTKHATTWHLMFTSALFHVKTIHTVDYLVRWPKGAI